MTIQRIKTAEGVPGKSHQNLPLEGAKFSLRLFNFRQKSFIKHDIAWATQNG